MIVNTIVDAATDNPHFSWDKKSQRYRDRSTGRFIRKSVVDTLSWRNVERVKADLATIGDLLIEGKISLRTWQVETANTLKILHAQQYVLGIGGQSQLQKEDYLEIGRELKSQYKYLQGFAYDVQAGNITKAQFKYRLQLYGNSSKVSFFRGKQKSARAAGYTHAKRLLGIAEHCPDCLRYHARGVVPIAELVLPTQACVCGPNCKCNVLYFRLSEAVNG